MISSSDSIKYIGNNIPELEIKNGDLLTDVVFKLSNGYLMSQKEINDIKNSNINSVNDSIIALSKQKRINVQGKYSGTLEVVITSGIGDTITFDLSDFISNIEDSIVDIETKVYGVPTGGNSLLFNSNKQVFGQTITTDKYPLYGTTKVRVWEDGQDVTYIANFEIGSNSIKKLNSDFEVEQKLVVQKTQEELNDYILSKLNKSVKDSPINIDGQVYNSWQQCCSALIGICNNLQQQINQSQTTITKSAANCGQSIKTEGCQNC